MPSAVSKLGGGPNVKIESQICFPKISRISVNLGSESELINKVYHSNYCQLTGTIDKVGIINEYGEYQILLTFKYLNLHIYYFIKVTEKCISC